MFLITPILIPLVSINYSSPHRIIVPRTENELENRLDECVDNIVRHFCCQTLNFYCETDLLTNVDLRQAKICRMNINSKNFHFPIKDAPKIILLDARGSMYDLIEYLEVVGLKKWKRTTIYLVESIELEFLRNISYLFTEYSYILDGKLNLHSLEAYIDGNASHTDLHFTNLGDCLSESTISKTGPLKHLKKWDNTTIRIFYRNMPPYVDYEENGVEQNILRIILNHLGMKNTSQIEKTTYQGGKNYTSGNYSNTALLYLQHKKVDVVVGAFHASDDTYNDFDGSLVYAVDTLNIIAPKSRRKPIWIRVLNIFTLKFCVMSVACLLLSLIFLHYFYSMSIYLTITWLAQIITDSPIYNVQTKCNFRLVMSTFLIFSLVHSTVFKSALEIIYFSTEYEKEIHTDKDAEESGLNIYALNMETFWKSGNLDDGDGRTLQMEVCTDVIECLDRVAFKRDSIMVFLYIPVLFSLPKYYTDVETSEPLLYIGQDLEILLLQMVFQKNYPPFKDVNHVLTRIIESGLYRYETNRKIWDWYLRQSHLKIFTSHLLRLRHLKFLFIIWAVGMASATLVFAGELIRHNYFRRNIFE